jgi:hypothetical protein
MAKIYFGQRLPDKKIEEIKRSIVLHVPTAAPLAN